VKKKKAVRSFKTSGSNYPTTRRNNQEDLVPQYENTFATNKAFSAASIPVRTAATVEQYQTY
jgi:hypothetical protein